MILKKVFQMNANDIISLDNEYIMSTYGRLPIVPVKGKNATMTDADGLRYIDFTSGIGVNSLGWCDDKWIDAVEGQLHKIQHMSNYFYCEPAAKVAEKLIKLSGLAKVFFGNSGAEANEGAIKIARKYSFDKYGEGRARQNGDDPRGDRTGRFPQLLLPVHGRFQIHPGERRGRS